jgi:hypothetical protein
LPESGVKSGAESEESGGAMAALQQVLRGRWRVLQAA